MSVIPNSVFTPASQVFPGITPTPDPTAAPSIPGSSQFRLPVPTPVGDPFSRELGFGAPGLPGLVTQRPLSIEDPEAFAQIQGGLFQRQGLGPSLPPDPLTELINQLTAAVGTGGGAVPEPAPPAPQQLDSAFSESLIQLIGGLFQAMLLSGQLGGGGAVGQQQAAPQVVFRSDLDRLGANRF